MHVKQSTIHSATEAEAFNIDYFNTPSLWSMYFKHRLQIRHRSNLYHLVPNFLILEGIWVLPPERSTQVNCFPALRLSLFSVAEILHSFNSINFHAPTQKLVRCNGSPEQNRTGHNLRLEIIMHYSRTLLQSAVHISLSFFLNSLMSS